MRAVQRPEEKPGHETQLTRMRWANGSPG
jgi:hypothetical protein